MEVKVLNGETTEEVSLARWGLSPSGLLQPYPQLSNQSSRQRAWKTMPAPSVLEITFQTQVALHPVTLGKARMASLKL